MTRPSADLLVAKNNSGRPTSRDVPRSGGVPDSPEQALGEAIKELESVRQEMAGQRGNVIESDVNAKSSIDQLSLEPGTQKFQYYYSDKNKGIIQGPYDRPGLYQDMQESGRFLRRPGPPQWRQGR